MFLETLHTSLILIYKKTMIKAINKIYKSIQLWQYYIHKIKHKTQNNKVLHKNII